MKKIPPPSETRWLFLGDALKALLEQTETVEAFVRTGKNMQKWREHISSSTFPVGQIKDAVFSFKNPLIDAHFRFASYIFDRLGDVNELFQVKYGFVHYFWEYMIPLHQIMKNELEKIEDSNFTTFPFLRKLETSQIPQFVSILKHLILNMNVRFFHVSSSLNKKNVRKFLNYDEVVIMPEAPVDGRERCGLLPILDVLNIRPWLVPRHLSESLSHLGLGDEWSRLVPVLRANWDNLEMSCRER